MEWKTVDSRWALLKYRKLKEVDHMQSITKNWFPPTIPSNGPSSAEIDTEASFNVVTMVLPEACCRQECYGGPTSKCTTLTFVELSVTSGPHSIIDVVAMVLPEACYRRKC